MLMEDPRFYLEGVVKEKDELQDFEGPLSLILMLLTKNKIAIRDIKIADILEQYLAYLDEMQSMDLEIASEFVQMAAHLLYIKTRTLLAGEDEQVSELEVLIASLEKLKTRDVLTTVREGLPELKARADVGVLYFTKLPEPPPQTSREYEYRHEPYELLKAMKAVFSRGVHPAEEDTELEKAVPHRITYSVRTKSRELIDLLRGGGVTLRELYLTCRTRSEIVATFIAILELCSMGSVSVKRGEDGDYTAEFTGGSTEEILEKIEE